MRKALLLLLGIALPVWGTEPPKLPEKVTGEPGTFIRVSAVTDCPVVQWYSPDSRLQLFPPDLLKNSKTAVVIEQSPATVTVIIGKDTDTDPDVPDPPDPDDDKIDDVLYDPIFKSYQENTNPDKRKHIRAFLQMYKTSREDLENGSFRTSGQFLNHIKTKIVPPLKIKGTWKELDRLVAPELIKVFSTNPEEPLTTDKKVQGGGVFSRLIRILEHIIAKEK